MLLVFLQELLVLLLDDELLESLTALRKRRLTALRKRSRLRAAQRMVLPKLLQRRTCADKHTHSS